VRPLGRTAEQNEKTGTPASDHEPEECGCHTTWRPLSMTFGNGYRRKRSWCKPFSRVSS